MAQKFQTGKFTWAIDELSKSLKITPEEVRLYFTDGRRVSFLLERRIADEVLHGKLAPSEGAGYDIMDKHEQKWEVRSISEHGIYFCPSYMVGSGRSFDEPGFLQKLDEIAGYVVSDIERFPNVPFWVIPIDYVREWWNLGKLGPASKISRIKTLKLLS